MTFELASREGKDWIGSSDLDFTLVRETGRTEGNVKLSVFFLPSVLVLKVEFVSRPHLGQAPHTPGKKDL